MVTVLFVATFKFETIT